MTKPDVAEAAKQLTDMAMRTAMRIAEHPLEDREKAYATAEEIMHETATQLGMPPHRVDGLIEMLMKGMRKFVLDMDVGGSPKGGNA
jgi:thermostable 8-oxoguanine DNA glycosylase